MSRNDYYDDYYEGSSFEKFRGKSKKNKHKGHQSKHGSREQRWAPLIEDYDNDYTEPTAPVPKPSYVKSAPITPPTNPPAKNTFQFGENTHEIKGVKIDFDGVQSIERIENIKDGIKTFGIKFNFKGNKGLYRTIWFNKNQFERDKVYAIEYNFWLKLQ